MRAGPRLPAHAGVERATGVRAGGVGLKPKAPFKAVFQVATAREGSGVALLPKGQPPAKTPGADPSLCFWWRRGRVGLRRKHRGLPVEHALIVSMLG